MLTLRGIITLIVLIVLFALAVVWISKQGGWKGEGCGGNLPQPLRKTGPEQKSLSSKMPPDIACWQRPGAFCFQLSVSR
jgi:hypothetical protein